MLSVDCQSNRLSGYEPHLMDMLGGRVAALAVAGLVTGGATPALLAWMDLSGAGGRDLAAFRFALDMEHAHADATLGFSVGEAPRYDQAIDLDLRKLASIFDLDRILCVVAMIDDGRVTGARSYGDLDLKYVEDVCKEFGCFSEAMASRGWYGEPPLVN